MWLARFPAACGLFSVIIALFATGGGDDNAPTSNSSGQAIAAYAATHRAGAFAGLGEVALLALAVFVVALYTALSRGEIAREAATKLGSFPAFFAPYSGGQSTDLAVARAMMQMNGYAFEITLFTQALLLSAVAPGLLQRQRYTCATTPCVLPSLERSRNLWVLGQFIQVAVRSPEVDPRVAVTCSLGTPHNLRTRFPQLFNCRLEVVDEKTGHRTRCEMPVVRATRSKHFNLAAVR
jgi:hypothetical protein